MAEVILTRIRNLERENRELRQELALTIAERDEAINKAVEMMHLNTYTMEKLNHKGLGIAWFRSMGLIRRCLGKGKMNDGKI